MYGTRRRMREYTPGTRVVSARNGVKDMNGRTTYGELRIETVVHVDETAIAEGRNTPMTLRSEDGERVVWLGYTSIYDDAPWRVVWTNPMPADDAEALRFAEAMLRHRDGDKPVMLWVAMRDGDLCYAHHLWDHDEFREGSPTQKSGNLRISGSPVRVRGLDGVVTGDVVLCAYGKALLTHQLFEHRVEDAVTVVHAPDLDAVGDLIPWFEYRSNNGSFVTGELAGPHVLNEAEEVAWTRTQPAAAMAMAWESGTGRRGRCSVAALLTSGMAFYMMDSPGDYLSESVPGPGLWVFEDAVRHGHWSYDGDYDESLDGNWRPAAREDLVDAFEDERSAAREMMGHLDGEPVEVDEDGVIDHFLALTAGTLAAEAQTEAV